MDHYTVLPFMVLFAAGLAAMTGHPIYQICRREMGTIRIDAHRMKPSAWARAALRRVTNAWRRRLHQHWPLVATLVLALIVSHYLPHGAGAILCAATPLNVLKQAVADNTAAQNKLKAEARKIPMASADRTPEQTVRLDAIDTELTALVDAAVPLSADLARALRYQEEQRAEGAALTVETLEVGRDRSDTPVTFGEALQAVGYRALEATGRPDRARNILPGGIAPRVAAAIEMQAAASGASSGNQEQAGLLVRSDWNTSLLNRVQEAGVLAPRCFPMPIGEGFDGVEAPFVDETSRASGSRWGGVQVYRGAEASAMTGAQPKLGKFELRLEDLFGLFYATDRVLRDAVLLEALATKAFTSEFAFKLDDEIVRGTGAGQCLGIIGNAPTVSVAKETNQAAATIKYENIVKMFSVLLARCMPGAGWYINQTCLPQLYTMSLAVGTGGVPVYMPANGASATPYGTLMGLPVTVIEQAAAVGTVGDIILANFSNDYAMISKPMTSASSIHVLFTSNQTTFRWVWPVIGKPTLSSAITPYKGSGTFGPFVTLATRS